MLLKSRGWYFCLLCIGVACSTGDPARHAPVQGGKHYGGVFNANETEEIRSIFPLSLSQASAHRIASQIYQGLVRFDPVDLSVRPSLAESWEIDASGTIYTFHLRKDVRFHDDPCFPDGKGRPFTSNDVIYCFTQLCTDRPDNQFFWLFQDNILGANSYFASTSNGVVPPEGVKGIAAPDEHTVRITLDHPMATFLEVMAHQGCWIYPHEMPEHYGKDLAVHAVGTGPFRLKVYRLGEVLVMERNPDHWNTDEHGNRLPFLDAVRYTLERDKEVELAEFRKGNLTVVMGIPGSLSTLTDSIDPVTSRQRYKVKVEPGLSTQFFAFNATRPPFNDIRVRKAFIMALDRVALVDSLLSGVGIAALHGFVAPGLKGYAYDSVKGIPYDPEQARELLADAGYRDGAGFPALTLQVNSDAVNQVRMAGAIQDVLGRELGVHISTSILPSGQHFERVEANQVEFWREGWIADFPDPENFLALFYGKNAAVELTDPSFLNTTRYKDPYFDSLFIAAQSIPDPSERNRLLALADQRLTNDAVILPVYHDMVVRLEQPYVRGFPLNPMEYRDLSKAWFDPDERRKAH